MFTHVSLGLEFVEEIALCVRRALNASKAIAHYCADFLMQVIQRVHRKFSYENLTAHTPLLSGGETRSE